MGTEMNFQRMILLLTSYQITKASLYQQSMLSCMALFSMSVTYLNV